MSSAYRSIAPGHGLKYPSRQSVAAGLERHFHASPLVYFCQHMGPASTTPSALEQQLAGPQALVGCQAIYLAQIVKENAVRGTASQTRLDTPRQVVSKWRKRFYDERLAGLTDLPRGGRPPSFSPDVVVAIKALACELPVKTDAPPVRWQCPDLARAAVESGIVAAISGTTIWRRLEFGCDQAVAASVRDLPPRPRLRCPGGRCPRPLRPPLR
jgi:hypothetical protein